MFDKGLLETDAFMDMPMPTKALYFLLGMEADDEGFVSPTRVMRIYGGNADDLKVLIAKKFVIQFESGVIVITDWKKNNWLDSRRVKKTVYEAEKALISESNEKYILLSNRLAVASPEESRVEEKRRDFFSSNQKIQELLDGGSITLGGEYSSDGRSPLIRLAEKRATEKALGLRKTPEIVRFIYKAGWDFREAFKEAKGYEYEGDVILDTIAKTLVEWHNRGRTTEDIQRLLEAFFRSKKAKELTVTPTSCFSEHTYQSFAQGTLK